MCKGIIKENVNGIEISYVIVNGSIKKIMTPTVTFNNLDISIEDYEKDGLLSIMEVL